MRVIVIGAGIVGITTAWELIRDGHQVSVIDSNPKIASGTSFANGGQLTIAEAAPWMRPHILRDMKLWRAMLPVLQNHAAPFHLRVRLSHTQWTWLYKAWQNTRQAAFETGAKRTWKLAQFSMKQLKKTCALLGKDLNFNLQSNGILQLYPNAQADAQIEEHIDALRRINIKTQWFNARHARASRTALIALEPALKTPIDAGVFGGALYVPQDASGDAHLFANQLATILRKIGVTFLLGQKVQKICSANGKTTGVYAKGKFHKADAVIVAAGCETPALIAPFGVKLPILPVKGYSLTLPLQSDAHAPQIALTDNAHRLVISRLGDRLRVAGYAEIGSDAMLNPHRIAAIHARIDRLFPTLNYDEAHEWCGFRPMTPDGAPIIDRITKQTGLYVNSGHGALGWSLCHGAARRLADMLKNPASASHNHEFAARRRFVSDADAAAPESPHHRP